jgi:hypothetical protein
MAGGWDSRFAPAYDRVGTTGGPARLASAAVLWGLAEQEGLGEVYSDGALVTCPAADLSTEPDVVFISEASLQSG